MEKEKENLRKKLLHSILQWDPKWFSEDKSAEQLRSFMPIKLKPSKLIYNNYNDYFETQLLTLIYDFWHQLEDLCHYDPHKSKLISFKLSKTLSSSALTCELGNSDDNKVCEIEMNANLPSYSQLFSLHQRHLVKLKNSLNGNVEEFAFVRQNNFSRSRNSPLICTLILKYQENIKIPDEVNLETVSVPVPVYMTLLDSLINLSESPLREAFLKPNFKDYEFPSIDYNHAAEPCELNPKQKDIIARIVKAVKLKKTGIFMVSGPAGTGKSKVVIHSIFSIISRKSTDKVLVLGQSNLAVDTIVLRLLEKGIFSSDIVRIGREKNMNEKVKSISFERHTRDWKRNGSVLLRKAKIIAGTFGSINSYMNKFFSGMEIPVCIIDEAPQVLELETCVPLHLGVKTMILVGDSNQFSPKIYSDEIKNQNLCQSLFLRAQKIFENDERNPIITLEIQYRMHEEIAKWPNKYFYKGALKNGVSVEPFDIYNYRVFGHSYESDDEGWVNVDEAKLVVNIIETLMTEMTMEALKDTVNLGIIVLSDQQRELIEEMLKKRILDISERRRNKFQWKVAKMSEAFQGSECDIIVLSCVRSSDHKYIDDPNRLCVSLTRAKHSLIICGNFEEYKKSKMWGDLIEDSQSRNSFFTIDDNNEPELLKQYLINNY